MSMEKWCAKLSLLELEIAATSASRNSNSTMSCPNSSTLHASVSSSLTFVTAWVCRHDMGVPDLLIIGIYILRFLCSQNIEFRDAREAIEMVFKSFLLLVKMQAACSLHPISHLQTKSLDQSLCGSKTAYLPSLTFL